MAQNATGDLQRYFEQIRTGGYPSFPASALNANNKSELLRSIADNRQDSVEQVRSRAYYAIKRIAADSGDPGVRSQAVGLLVSGVSDRSAAVNSVALSGLQNFSREDFGNGEKQSLNSFLGNSAIFNKDELVRLVGFINDSGETTALSSSLSQATGFRMRWAYQIALARLGDQRSVDFLLSRIQAAPINDDFVYDIIPDLVYTRNKQIFQFIDEMLMDPNPRCESASPDNNEALSCGYKLLEYYARTVANFPLTLDEYGDLDLDDYQTGLATARTWVNSNPDYSVLNDKY